MVGPGEDRAQHFLATWPWPSVLLLCRHVPQNCKNVDGSTVYGVGILAKFRDTSACLYKWPRAGRGGNWLRCITHKISWHLYVSRFTRFRYTRRFAGTQSPRITRVTYRPPGHIISLQNMGNPHLRSVVLSGRHLFLSRKMNFVTVDTFALLLRLIQAVWSLMRKVSTPVTQMCRLVDLSWHISLACCSHGYDERGRCSGGKGHSQEILKH
jgi:hypothetical protein